MNRDEGNSYKTAKYIDWHFENGLPSETTLQIISILAFQGLFGDFGEKTKRPLERVIKCSNGQFIFRQGNLDPEQDIYGQLFLYKKRGSKTEKPLMRCVWNKGELASIETNVTLNADFNEDDKYKELLDIFESLGTISSFKMCNLCVAFAMYANELLETCIKQASEQHITADTECINELPV